MNTHEKTLITEIALIFHKNKKAIFENWMKLMHEDGNVKDTFEFNIIKNGFKAMLEDFIIYLSKDDYEGYFEKNSLFAKEIAFNDISFKKLITSFHLFEDSYISILTDAINDMRVIKYLSAIDKLHHNTIAIISEEYFNIKDITVNALVKLSELRDDSTGRHLERTREYLMILAKAMNLDNDFIEGLYKAGPLHDIGKVGIRDSILLKPCKLTNEEFEEMKRHTIIGANTIERVLCDQNVCRGYLKMARDIALYHHERFDGSGYPEGLEGEKIPLSARIFAVVDAYDAIVSKRPYKESLSHEEALKRILADSGSHFDPVVVSSFLKTNELFRNVNEKYKEKDQDEITA